MGYRKNSITQKAFFHHPSPFFFPIAYCLSPIACRLSLCMTYEMLRVDFLAEYRELFGGRGGGLYGGLGHRWPITRW